ncbi:MAG: site-specific integrase [Pseudomonadota bacterium]|nr:site-specific integrase [Pseudomonadota bacterium]
MARIKLTAGRIRDFTTDKSQAFLWDSEAPGLAVRATPSGKSAFIFQGKLNRKDIRCTIGDVGTWGIDLAREEARRLGTLVDQGIDPREQKRERIAASEAKREALRQHDVTVSEAWNAYIEARMPRWSARHLQNHLTLAQTGGEKRKSGRHPGEPETTLPGPVHSLLNRRLGDIDGNAMKAWLSNEIERGPSQAEQAFRVFRTFIGWCAEHDDYKGVVNADACAAKALREMVPKVKPKDDVLQKEQLSSWFAAVRRIRNPVIAAYLQALLVTGARREELAGLTWDGIDFQWKTITIHDKVEGDRTIPLTPLVGELLASLPRRKDAEGKPLPWVFSSPTAANGRLQEPRKQHINALEAAGLPHLSLHGLRRSFGTLAEWTEAPVGVVAQIMGHKPSAIAEKHYRRRPLDLLRMWHTRIEASILEQAGIEQPEEGQQGLRLVKGNAATSR